MGTESEPNRVRSSRRFLSRRVIAGVITIGILAGLVGGTFGYLELKGRADRLQATLTVQLQAGQRELEAGNNSLVQANNKRDMGLIAQAVGHFDAAKQQFLKAGEIADSSRLLHDLELVPAAGSLVRSRHVAVTGISGMGAALAKAGTDLADLDAQLIKPA